MKETLPVQARADAQIIFDSIRRIVQAIRHSSKTSEKKLGISTAQLFVLQKIAESSSPPSINDLAESSLTHQSSVSVVVSKLVRRKLVERVKSKSDSRSVELRLTTKGETRLASTPTLVQERLIDAIVNMGKAERQSLVQGLQTLIQKSGLHGEEPSLFFEDRRTL